MGIGQTVRTAVVDDVAMAALVDDRVYPLVYPSNPTFPCVTYRVISGYAEPVTAERVYTTRVQFDIWTDTYMESATIKQALMELFYYMTEVVDGQQIITSKVDLNFDTFEQNVKMHRSVVDIRITHEGE